jgi:hypothetical protein
MSTSLKTRAARRAAKAAAKHSANGAVSKLKRSPSRSITLLALGGALGFLLGRMTASASE